MRHALPRRLLRGLPGLAVGLALVTGLTTVPIEQAAAETPDTSITTLKVTSAKPQLKNGGGSDRRSTGDRQVVAELGEQATDPFSTVGVTWSSASTGTAPEVQVRTKQASGDWSDWETITDGAPLEAESGRLATDPIYVGDADGIELRVLGDATTTLKEVEVALVKSPQVAGDANPKSLAAAETSDMAPRPSIITRNGWGADEKLRCDEDKMGRTIRGAVVHHTAGSNSYSKSASASIIRDIYAYHTKTLGWCDIGYNFLVDKYGQIFEGRWGGIDKPIHGSHAADWNTDTMGISFMGNYETASPPSAMLTAGAKVLAWKLDAYQRAAKGKITLAGKSVNVIFGHGDVMATACPGKNIRSKMASLRDDVEKRMGKRGPLWTALQDRGGVTKFGQPHDAERAVNGGRVGTFILAGNVRTLYSHPAHGAYSVHDSIRTLYLKLGGPTHDIGWPTSEERATGAVSKQSFAGGRIYSSAKGTYAVWGEIGKEYRALGEESSKLGLPVSSEKKVSEGRAVDFEGGRITWNTTTKKITVSYK